MYHLSKKNKIYNCSEYKVPVSTSQFNTLCQEFPGKQLFGQYGKNPSGLPWLSEDNELMSEGLT